MQSLPELFFQFLFVVIRFVFGTAVCQGIRICSDGCDLVWGTLLSDPYYFGKYICCTGRDGSFFYQKRDKGICRYDGCLLFFSQFFLESLYKLSGNNLDLWHMKDLFGLTTRMYHAAADYDYIFSIESVDLQRILFWIFATATILICYLAPGRKWFFTICSGVIMVILFVLYMQPNGASYLNVNMVSDANDEEHNYYNAHTEQIGTLEHCESEVNFKITKYVADIHVNRILSADVEVYID